MKCLRPGFFIFALLLPVFSLGATTYDAIKKEMIGDLDFIKQTFEIQYAPLEWRKNHFDWDIAVEIEAAKKEVLNTPDITVKEYRAILKKLFNSSQDYHVGIQFYSTEAAYLPFKIKGADNRYFISYIDRKRLSRVVYPIKIGDELILFDGKPIDEVMQEFKLLEVGPGNAPSRQAIAESYFSVRLGKMGHEIPKGPVSITVRDVDTGALRTYQLIWEYVPEELNDVNFGRVPPPRILAQHAHFNLNAQKRKHPLGKNPIFQKPFALPFFSQLKDPKIADNAHSDELGSRISFIPPLGEKIWQSDPNCSFYAYLYEHKNRTIGYIRIPHYLGDEKETEEFQTLITFLQQESDALIIDQVNNPGGSVFYLYSLASMLTDRPLSTPKHRIAITQKEVIFALEAMPEFKSIRSDDEAMSVIGDTLDGNPVTYQMAQFFLNYFRFIIGEWNSGNIFTGATYLWGIDHINPHGTCNYTKPILVLVNSLDFSGGDFFPAIMQDNHRALIMGSRTAGAGGFVLGSEFPNLLGIEYIHYTGSMAERDDKIPIENSGVTPDIEYQITTADLQHNYVHYLNAIHNAVDKLLK